MVRLRLARATRRSQSSWPSNRPVRQATSASMAANRSAMMLADGACGLLQGRIVKRSRTGRLNERDRPRELTAAQTAGRRERPLEDMRQGLRGIDRDETGRLAPPAPQDQEAMPGEGFRRRVGQGLGEADLLAIRAKVARRAQ